MDTYNGKDQLKPKLLNGSFVTPSLLANIVVSRFQLGVPLYRQEQNLERKFDHHSLAEYVQIDDRGLFLIS